MVLVPNPMSSTSSTLLLVTGYPVSAAVLTRWLPVVRERRWPWFIAHQAGVAAVVAGWLLRGRTGGGAVNAGWLVLASVWFALGGRTARGRPIE